jgi:pyruvate formate lyase activating enzyme
MDVSQEAMFYEQLKNQIVRCNLCSHRCLILPSKKGICNVRENRNGKLYTLVYGRTIAKAVDPIEKKPLFHFYPGSSAYSIATVGCNFRCKNCQNYDISQLPAETSKVIGDSASPESIVSDTQKYECKSIAYTYTEPTIFYEYAYDTAKLAHKETLKNIFVTNGYISEAALKELQPYLDAANIDLKSFNDSFYRNMCGARLTPVLDSICLYKELGIWIEITTLIITTVNDSNEELQKIATFIHDELGPEVPWHISAFHPTYKILDLPRTPVDTLRRAKRIGLENHLQHIYIGNVPGEGDNTSCPKCGETLIKRINYQIVDNLIVDGKCLKCKVKMNGVWS